MNERIKELAKQAEEFHYSTWDAYNQKTVNHYRLNTEKFAELIVQECAEIAIDVSDGLTVATAIRKHFGIKS